MKIIGTKIEAKKGVGVIEEIYITELNLIMVRVCFGKSWTNYRLSDLPEIKKILFEANE